MSSAEAEAIDQYGEVVIPSGNYRSFITSTMETKEEAAGRQVNLIQFQEEVHYNEELNYSMVINPDSLVYVDDVEFSLFWNRGDDVVYLGSDNEVLFDWDTGYVEDHFQGAWPMLNDEYVTFYLIEVTDEYSLYSIPVLLNGVETNLRVIWQWFEEEQEDGANGEYTVLGAWDGIDAGTGMASRNIRPVEDGDVIVPLFYSYGEEEDKTLRGEEIVVSGELIVGTNWLEPGEYWYQFDVRDTYGGYTSTDYAVFEIDADGTIYVE